MTEPSNKIATKTKLIVALIITIGMMFLVYSGSMTSEDLTNWLTYIF